MHTLTHTHACTVQCSPYAHHPSPERQRPLRTRLSSPPPLLISPPHLLMSLLVDWQMLPTLRPSHRPHGAVCSPLPRVKLSLLFLVSNSLTSSSRQSLCDLPHVKLSLLFLTSHSLPLAPSLMVDSLMLPTPLPLHRVKFLFTSVLFFYSTPLVLFL